MNIIIYFFKVQNPLQVFKFTSVLFCFRKRGYIGDMEISDFSSPNRRRTNLRKIKGSVKRDKIQIRGLQQSVRRLKTKIGCLKSLMEYFKEKAFISDGSESTLLVRNFLWKI